MRIALLAILMLFPVCTLAVNANAICYNRANGQVVYEGRVVDPTVDVDNGIFFFQEMKTNKVVIVAADCLVKISV